MSEEVLEDIRKIRDLLKDRSRWTKNELARDSSGKEIRPQSPDAVCWCIEGACIKITAANDTWLRLKDKARSMYDMCPFMVNDSKGHTAVLKLLDSIKEDLENEPKRV